jgi:hypothetical protein
MEEDFVVVVCVGVGASSVMPKVLALLSEDEDILGFSINTTHCHNVVPERTVCIRGVAAIGGGVDRCHEEDQKEDESSHVLQFS